MLLFFFVGYSLSSDKIERFFIGMSVRKNQSKLENTAFLLVNIYVLIKLYALTIPEKETFNFGTSYIVIVFV